MVKGKLMNMKVISVVLKFSVFSAIQILGKPDILSIS